MCCLIYAVAILFTFLDQMYLAGALLFGVPGLTIKLRQIFWNKHMSIKRWPPQFVSSLSVQSYQSSSAFYFFSGSSSIAFVHWWFIGGSWSCCTLLYSPMKYRSTFFRVLISLTSRPVSSQCKSQWECFNITIDLLFNWMCHIADRMKNDQALCRSDDSERHRWLIK